MIEIKTRESPLLTVLMTAYNGGEYLALAVRSILQQTFKDFEFLIIDDCSTDKSLEAVVSLNDRRIQIVRNEKNLGQTRSLNVGLKLARGAYIARIDADDLAFPHWLHEQWTFMMRYPQLAVVSTKACVIDGKSRIKKVLNTPVSSNEIILKSLFASPINHVGSLMNKDIVLSVGGYDESYKIAADYALWSRLIREGYRMMVTGRVSVAVRVHEDSISIVEKGGKALDEVSRIICSHVEGLTSLKINESQAHLLWSFIYNPSRLSDREFNEARQLISKVYDSLNQSLAIEKDLVRRFVFQLLKVVYVKRIFSLIEDRNVKGAKDLALSFRQEYGSHYFFNVVIFLSLFGNIFLNILPKLFEVLNVYAVKSKLILQKSSLSKILQ